jgi:hypothetical protein
MASRAGLVGVGAGLVALCLIGCGSSPGAADGGPDAAAEPDAGSGPTCAEAGPLDDSGGAAAPVGTQLQAGSALSVRGVTSDGHLIYSDDDALTLHAIPLAGGQAQDLGALGAKFWVTIVGDVVFSWSNVTGDVGALSTWTAKTGVHSIASASVGIDATASGDQILYTDHVANGTGDVYLANVDGSGAIKLLSGMFVDPCFPGMGFAGSTAIVSFCPVEPPQAAVENATVSAFASPAFSRVDLATNAANYWSTDGTHVLVSSASAGISAVPIGGGAPVTIDSDGFFGTYADSGQAIFYSTRAHAFRRSPAATPAPLTLVGSGFGGAYGLSPDLKWVLYFSNFGATGTDIYLANATTPAPTTKIWPDETGAVIGDAFTGDSSHALYASSIDPCTQIGTLHAFATTGGADTVLGSGVFSAYALGKTSVIFSDHYGLTGGLRFGRADIEVVDLAKGSTPTQLVSRADAVFGLSPAQDQLIYSWSVQPGLAGIYVLPL